MRRPTTRISMLCTLVACSLVGLAPASATAAGPHAEADSEIAGSRVHHEISGRAPGRSITGCMSATRPALPPSARLSNWRRRARMGGAVWASTSRGRSIAAVVRTPERTARPPRPTATGISFSTLAASSSDRLRAGDCASVASRISGPPSSRESADPPSSPRSDVERRSNPHLRLLPAIRAKPHTRPGRSTPYGIGGFRPKMQNA